MVSIHPAFPPLPALHYAKGKLTLRPVFPYDLPNLLCSPLCIEVIELSLAGNEQYVESNFVGWYSISTSRAHL
jgi:hypothetical protein